MLALNGVSKAFGGLMAVNCVNLSLERGEVRALIGPNGAGKSTLLNVITGYFTPDAGTVRFKDENIAGLPPHRICQKGIARSFQITSIFPRLSAIENVHTALMARRGRCRSLFSAASRVLTEEARQLLEFVGMAAQADRVAGELAQGDRKRLELAMALAGEPELLLLDEPTAGMSPTEKTIVTDVIKLISDRKGVTVLFTEHDVDVVFSVAKKITVIHQGSIIAEGLPAEVRADAKVQRIYLGERDDVDA